MIVLDASVLIAYLDPHDAHHLEAEGVLRNHVDDDLALNTLTLAEVLVGPVSQGRLDVVLDAVRDLGIEQLSFPPQAAVRLARLRAETRLGMPDCCVLFSAQEQRADLATFDRRLHDAASERGLSTSP